jgi:hypothetical protein
MIQVLQSAYYDTTQGSAARDKLRDLTFDWSVAIGPFLANFNSLHQKAGTAPELLKTSLHEILPVAIRTPTYDQAKDLSVSYETFCDKVYGLASDLARDYAKKRSAQPKISTKTKSTKQQLPRSTTQSTSTTTTTGTRPRLGKLTDGERDYLKKNNGCFKCRQIGHISPECPIFPSTTASIEMPPGQVKEESSSESESGKE